MTPKEPKAMAELHRIRERMSTEYGKKSSQEINRKLVEKTDDIVTCLKLPRARVSVGMVREK